MTGRRGIGGRPRIHFDGADRSRAYRERRQAKVEDAEIALDRWETPTPGFVGFIAKRCVQQAENQTVAAQAVIAKALEGIAIAGGPAALSAAISFVTSRNSGKEPQDGVD